MVLAVDIGNTNVKIGAWDDYSLVFVGKLQTNTLKTQDEYAVNLLDILRLNDCNSSQFDGAIISSVVPQLSQTFRAAVSAVIRTQRVFLVGPGIKTGLNIKIDNPATLGADMVCCAVSAAEKYPMPCIIVSMGTATAIFALDGNAAFLGGAVAPGVAVSLEALSRHTAQLPHIGLDEPGDVIGTNTVDCMKSGSIYGAAAMLDGMLARMKEQLGGSATVVATGGIAQYIVRHCREEIIMDDSMVLDGLRIIYGKNVKPV